MIISVDDANSRRPKELANIRPLLKTGGKLIAFQNHRERDRASLLPLVTLPGWWAEDRNDCDRGENGKTVHNTLMVVILM